MSYANAEEQVADGAACRECGRYISSKGVGFRRYCYDCADLDKPEELSHGDYIRCPKCKDFWRPSDAEQYKVYSDGEHKVSCSNCDHDFEVSTSVNFTFTSPELIQKEERRAEVE